jgi:hypothetical protein
MQTSIITHRPYGYAVALVDLATPLAVEPALLTRAAVEYGPIEPVAFTAGRVKYGQAAVLVKTSQMFLNLVEDLAWGEGVLLSPDKGDQPIVLIDEHDLKVVLNYDYLDAYVNGAEWPQQFEVPAEGVLLRMGTNEYGNKVVCFYV